MEDRELERAVGIAFDDKVSLNAILSKEAPTVILVLRGDAFTRASKTFFIF